MIGYETWDNMRLDLEIVAGRAHHAEDRLPHWQQWKSVYLLPLDGNARKAQQRPRNFVHIPDYDLRNIQNLNKNKYIDVLKSGEEV